MPDVSIHEEDGSTMPQGKCIEGDSRIKTSVGSTSTTIVRRYDGMRTFPSSSHTEESSLPVQSKICPNYDFYHEQQHNLTSDELESIKEDLEICSQMLVDDDDFNEAKYVDRNTFQDQTFDIPIDETFTKTHKQQNDVSDPDDDHYNNFAANISKHGQIADVSMTNTYTEYYNAGQQPIYEINEEGTIENDFKRLMSSEEIEVCKDNVPQPQPNIFPETSPQINDPQFLSKIRPENAERYNLTNIQFEENTILPKPSKHKKPNYFSKIKKCEGGKNMDQTGEKVADKNEGNTFAKPNTYKYYLSPILVNVIEGPDEKTLSIEEDDSSTKEPFVQPGEIDILEHIILTPKGTLISAVNKAQGHRISGDVVAENLDLQNVDQNYDIDNREVCDDTEIRETDEAGYDEDITSEDANSQENIRAVQHENKLKQSYKETEFGKDPVTCEIAAVDQDESFESIACSQNKVTEKASDALDQSTASFKSVTGRSTDYESAHDQFNIEVQMSSAQPVKIIARFVSCDDEGDAKEQMTHIGIDNIGGRDIPEGKSYMKDNHNTETNNKVEDEKLVIIKDHTSSESGDKKESSIGVTDASRMRNLDNCTDTSEDSKTVTEDTKFHTSCGSTSSDKKRSSPVTSVSSASKKRNLDHVTDTTTITIMENDHASESTITPRESSNTSNLKNDESKSTTGEGNFNIVTKQKKMTKRKKIPQDQSKTESSLNSKLTKPNSKVTKKFIPPRKLSAKEIREEFEMQDNKLFELTKSTPNSSDMSKYLERLMNRPRVKEVQNTTHLALIRKTEQGVEVIPAEPSKPRKRKQTALRKHFSNENVDMSMFSDKNARCFEKFLDSDERNYSSFRFNFQKTESAFKFDQIEMKAGEYTDGSITMSFTRKTSETSEKPMFKPDFNLENQSTSGGFNFQGFKTEMSKTDIKCGQYSQSDRSGITSFVRKASNMSMEQSQMTFKPDFSMSGIHNQTFTPDGYFKQNKDDITNILNKYRQLSSQDTATGGRSRNIFESSDSINCEEFKL
ncbi:unnamed protein product [Acanthoscelides obtectus]|nr:unnamed protein product [Acanthoscelides obtectus]CAK1666869.1 hypothetical protein AOBTE_LOCUS25530 [Acanthoscelides obtectus]